MHVHRPLCVLLVGLVLLCWTAQAIVLQITVIDSENDAPIGGASLYVDGEYVGMTGADGTYSYIHSATKTLHLKATKSGYGGWVGLVGAAASSVLVEMARTSEVLAVELYDAGTFLPVKNALVRVHGDGFEGSRTTGADGRAEFEVKTGALYNVEIRAQNYYPASKTVQMGSSGKVVQYWLFRSDTFAVQVRDAQTGDPISGAEVTVDNAVAGTTDADGLLSLHLQRETKHAFVVEAEDYQPYRVEKLLGAEDVLLTVPLSRSIYPVSVSVFDEEKRPVENADVYLNGTWQGKTGRYGRCSLPSVEAGVYEIAVKAPGYEDWVDVRRIARTGEDLAVELAYARAAVLVVAEDGDHQVVPGATILIDGQLAGVTDEQGRLQISLRTRTTYNVSAYRDGYRSASLDLEIPMGASEYTVLITLERSLDAAIIGGVGLVCIGAAAFVLWRRRRGGWRRRRPSKERDL